MAMRPDPDLRRPVARRRGARRNRLAAPARRGVSRRVVVWGVALLCVVAAAMAAALTWRQWAPLLDLRAVVPTIKHVRLYGPLQEVQRADVLAALAPLTGVGASGASRAVEAAEAVGENGAVGPDFFRFNARAARAALERLPWVQRAEVRKEWPDALTITLHEQRAVAVWADGGYLNGVGERFVPAQRRDEERALPILSGPPGSERELFGLYDAIHARLALIGQRAARLAMDERGALTVTLAEGGVSVLLGRERTLRRIDRLTQVYTRLRRAAPGPVKTVDLRYARGLALRLKRNESDRDAARPEG